MKQYNFFLTYALLVLIQMVICNYFHLSAYILLSILPVMVLCIPIRYSTTMALCIAFVTRPGPDAPSTPRMRTASG